MGGRAWTEERVGRPLELGATSVRWMQPHLRARITHYDRAFSPARSAADASGSPATGKTRHRGGPRRRARPAHGEDLENFPRVLPLSRTNPCTSWTSAAALQSSGRSSLREPGAGPRLPPGRRVCRGGTGTSPTPTGPRRTSDSTTAHP
ncbi:hypothetical protein QJS66_13340 [Kocuria rhizophila]|nr:hypothetical protein QJS66_13340 [Kocuria rhizophila]